LQRTHVANVLCSVKSEVKFKIALVFLHQPFRLVVWPSGKNKQVLTEYWILFKESDWNKYKIVSPAKGVDFIVEHVSVDNPDFSDLEALTTQIEQGTLEFVQDGERFLLR
jgi:hypothetical protein